ncbi:MAG: HAMP domain-containing histidine kinase [Rhodospirillales bacterium]|nr:HAMP domain-containing histidine kinase [Rhodospirillales bacterium]
MVAIVVALALAGLGLVLLFDRQARRGLAEDLDVHLRQLVAGIDLGADGRLTINRPPADPRFGDPLSGLYWQAGDDRDQLLRSRSLWDAILALPVDDPTVGTIHRHEVAGPGGTRLLVAERRVQLTVSGTTQAVRLAVAADLGRVAASRRAFARELVPALGVLAIALGAAAWAQVQLGLRPLRAVRSAVAEIREGKARRLVPAVPLELRPLVDELNALLEAQERDIVRSRDRAADLAHGLKTPLSALAADARRLQERGQHDIASEIDDLVDAMRRHVDRELVRVRLRGPASGRVPESALLLPLLRGLVATLARTPAGERVVVDVAIPAEAAVPIERTDLAEVLGNLLENAVRHAHGRVRVTIEPGAQPGVLVEDDGPGVAEGDRQRILERGRRLDSGGGAGLGLAIVQDVLEAYGWRLRLRSSPLGGLAASIAPAELPD